ncbi:hypothetical protein PSCICG_40160 [Pseudomonas cichorii]|nr:hypothetical protein PSCICG_40160 [Pseudomonas cichorii]
MYGTYSYGGGLLILFGEHMLCIEKNQKEFAVIENITSSQSDRRATKTDELQSVWR